MVAGPDDFARERVDERLALAFLAFFRGVLIRFQRTAWMAARATTGDIPMRTGNVGSARLAGERPCDWSAITVITAVLTFPDVSIARA